MVTAAQVLPPHDLEAEMSVLGSMMVSPNAVELALERCKQQDFYRPIHQTIFDAICSLVDRSEPVDVITVKDELLHRGVLEDSGGIDYLTQLVDTVPTAANAGHYAELVRRNSMLRSLLSASDEIRALVHSDRDFQAVFDMAEHKIMEAGQRRIGRMFQSANDLIHEYFEQVQEAFDTGKKQMGIPTGFADLDQLTTGLYASDFIIVAARPSVGKTALVLHIAMNIALRQQLPVAFFSLEMSASQLVQRMICSQAPVNSQRTRTVNLRTEDFQKIHEAADRLYKIPLWIDDSSELSTLEVLAKCRRLRTEHGLGLIVVDYLQLMRSASRTENRTQEIGEIARGLKRIAKELEVPVIALSQLSRNVEHRENKRPMLSDLRESGSIEAEADLVLMMYRDSYYKRAGDGEDSDEEQYKPSDGTSTDKVEVNLAKHRNGPTGLVTLAFQPEFARFLSYERGGE